MTTERKAEILTEAEVNGLSDYVWSPRIIATIRQMAGLLEEECDKVVEVFGSQHDCGTAVAYIHVFCEPCQRKQALLARYKGERT